MYLYIPQHFLEYFRNKVFQSNNVWKIVRGKAERIIRLTPWCTYLSSNFCSTIRAVEEESRINSFRVLNYKSVNVVFPYGYFLLLNYVTTERKSYIGPRKVSRPHNNLTWILNNCSQYRISNFTKPRFNLSKADADMKLHAPFRTANAPEKMFPLQFLEKCFLIW